MSTNKRTEDIIKDKFDSREFAFDESAWAEAEKMIVAQQGSKTRTLLLWIFSANMVIGLIALLAWLMPFDKTQDQADVIATNNGNNTLVVATNDNSSPEPKSAVSANENALNTETTASPAIEEPKAEKQTLASNDTKPVSKTSKPAPAPKAEKPTSQKQADDKSANSTPLRTADDKKNTIDKPQTTKKENDKKSNGTEASNLEMPVADEDEVVSAPKETEPNEVAAVTNTPDDEKKEAIAEQEKALPQEKPISEQALEAAEKGTAAVDGQAKADRLAELTKLDEDESGSSPKPGSSSGADTKRKKKIWPPQIPKPQPPAKGGRNNWTAMAGMSLWDPYASTLGARSWNGVVGASAGLGYERALTKRFWFGINAIYWSRGALNFNHVINESVGTPGTNEYVNYKSIITPSAQHILNVPLYIKFDVARRHHAMIGLSGSYLMATTYESKKLKESATTTEDLGTRKITGQHPGFYKYDLMLIGGYEYSITDRLLAGTRINYGFYDRTRNNYKNITSYDKNICLEFTLRYDFLRH